MRIYDNPGMGDQRWSNLCDIGNQDNKQQKERLAQTAEGGRVELLW